MGWCIGAPEGSQIWPARIYAMSNSIAARGRKWILAPFYLGQLVTAAKSFEANPFLGSARLNALGLHKWRVATAYRMAERRRAKLAKFVAPEDRAAFERDGFVVKRNFLPQPVFDELLTQIKQHRCTVEERAWGETINRKIIVDSAMTAK